MDYRKIGRSGLDAAPLAFGGNVIGWTLSRADTHKVLDRFLDRGFNLIDTADVYISMADTGVGTSEIVLGEWLKASGKRNDVLIATKVGMQMPAGQGLSAAYIQQAVEASLKRLQVDHIDLYQAHKDDSETPLEETMEAFGRLVKDGKVRVLGASNYSAERLGEALDVATRLGLPRYESLQPHYNAVKRDEYEGALQDLCVREEIGVISFFSLASGFLTGKYRSVEDMDGNSRSKIAKRYATPQGFAVVAAMVDVAEKHGVPPAQVALAWSMAQPGIVAPIASAVSIEQLDQILGAADLTLNDGDMQTINAAFEAMS